MISANGGLPANRYTPQVTQRWPRGSKPASPPFSERCIRSEVIEERTGGPQWAPTPPPHVPSTHGGPTYTHNNIHLSLSTIFFFTSSWFFRLTFNWVSGLLSCKGYAPHYN